MTPSRPLPLRWFLVFTLLFVLQVVPRLAGDSLTSDEPNEITNGYSYLTRGDVLTHHRHPPFTTAWQALPLLALPLDPPSPGLESSNRAFEFFFVRNRGFLGPMTVLPRLMTLLLGVLAGFLVYRMTRGSPPAVPIAALALWAFDPALLAFSGYALADVPVTVLFLGAVLAFERAKREKDTPSAVLAGCLTGLAACSKFSALVLLPVFLALEGWERSRSRRAASWKGLLSRWGWGASAFILVVALVYLPGTLRMPDHREPLHYFLSGLSDMVRYSGAHHPTFFMGAAHAGNHWLYYPTAFLLKSPVPFLLLLAGAALFRRSRLGTPRILWVPPLLVFISILPVQNLGVRYLLLAHPFLIVLAARAAGSFWEEGKGRKRWVRTLIGGLLLWQAGSVAMNFPRHLSYFNDLVPRTRKAFWLGDSNLDIGQDLGRLAETAKQRGWREVRLAYFGPADPSAYGLNWTPWSERDLTGPQPGCVYAIHIGFLQMAPAFFPQTLPLTLSWVVHERPTGRVGETWYFFEIPPEKGAPPGPDVSDRLPSVPTLRLPRSFRGRSRPPSS